MTGFGLEWTLLGGKGCGGDMREGGQGPMIRGLKRRIRTFWYRLK